MTAGAISWKEAVPFFDEIAPNATCPACSTSDFELITDTDGNVDIGHLSVGSNDTEFIPLMLSACLKCGFLMTFTVVQFNKWRERRTGTSE
jgi:Zn ribbon nucleic-acid-binding protein